MLKERIKRVEELIQEEVADILQKEIKDPRIGFVTVSGVKVSKDLQNALVFVTVLGSEDNVKKSLECLENATGFVRVELSKRLKHMKYCPKITFKFDDTLQHADKINRLLKKIQDEEKK